jgi:diguanylate cyclase (GGDEF)-like protein
MLFGLNPLLQFFDGLKHGTMRDAALLRARQSGERIVAMLRLGVVVLFLCFMVPFIRHPSESAVAFGALAYAASVLWLSFNAPAAWVTWPTVTIDITLITAALSVFVAGGDPLGALQNRVFFDLYFFAIAISALRVDWRVCLYATTLSISEFLALIVYIAIHWDIRHLASPAGEYLSLPGLGLRVVVLAAHGATIVALASWVLHLRLLINTDQLTGLAQRRPFLERVEEELALSRGGQGALAVAVLDVDHFRRFNDEFGHAGGDDVLRQLGGCLRAAVRGTDLVSRWGGEEFLVAFPGATVDHAMRRAEDIRVRVSRMPVLVKGTPRHITVSIGVAAFPADGRGFDQLLAVADGRLYEAKTLGRNKTVGPQTAYIPLPPDPHTV